jgi:hypothetical protein
VDAVKKIDTDYLWALFDDETIAFYNNLLLAAIVFHPSVFNFLPIDHYPIMKFLSNVLVATLAVLSSPSMEATTLPEKCSTNIPRDSCAFYTECLEQTLPCGPQGYAINYGGHFCQAFAANADEFSTMGKQWISDVMYCLQNELVPLLQALKAPTCKNIKDFAFDSHPGCYLKAGVCTLPLNDWLAIANVIGFKQLFLDLAAIKQQVIVAANCPVKWHDELVKLLLGRQKLLLRH